MHDVVSLENFPDCVSVVADCPGYFRLFHALLVKRLDGDLFVHS
jgi:hypothetical protein